MIRKALIAAVAALGLLATGGAAAGGWYGGYTHYRHYHDRDAGDLAAGIVFGALVGIALSDAWSRADTYYYAPYGYREYAYRPAPPRYAPPRAVYVPAPPVTAAGCLQTREYTTTVTIDGRVREAYGTACLQPDGSWLRGPARVVPDY